MGYPPGPFPGRGWGSKNRGYRGYKILVVPFFDDQQEFQMSRIHLQNLLSALDASPRALQRDLCGDWQIAGRSGHIFGDGAGYLLYVHTGESPRRWTNVKHRLEFCRVSQDGDDEGVLHLDRLPTPGEAELIRDAVGVRRRRHLSPAQQVRLANLAGMRKGSVKPASAASGSRQDHEGPSLPRIAISDEKSCLDSPA